MIMLDDGVLSGAPGQVFIVGPPRSGTSIIMRAVRDVLPNHHAFTEGHLIDIIPHVTDVIRYFFLEDKKHYRQYEDFMITCADQAQLTNLVVDVIVEYYKKLAGDCFIEKTHGPSMIYALPHLKRAFPAGKVIALQRRAIEYMRSAEAKFTLDSWQTNLDRWVACVNALRMVASELGDYLLVIDHYDIVHHRQRTASKIASHLGMGDGAASTISDIFASVTIEKTPGTSYEPLDLDALRLDSESADSFRKTVKGAFEHLGYSFDRRYFLSDRSDVCAAEQKPGHR